MKTANSIVRKAAEICLLVCLRLLPSSAAIEEANEGTANNNFTYALIAKNINNPFFGVVREGCVERSLQLSSSSSPPPSKNVNCLYVGPEEDDAGAQADYIDAMINGTYGHIHGISISVSDPDIVSPAINRAVAAGIPVITFDSDAENSDRVAYVGTDNVAFGVELGKLLDQLAPQGGKYGVLSNSAPNVVQRFDGVTKRLADDSNWTPIQDSYKDCNDDIATALKIMYEFADMGVQAIIPVGGWPMWDKEGWKEFFNSNKDKNLTLIVGDTLEVQMQLMNEGYANGLVGQLPFNMGKDSIDVLWSLTNAEEVSEVNHITAFLEVLRFPLVLPKLEVDDNYIGRLAIFGYVLFALIAVSSLGLMVWTYLHKNTRVIKASQPFFLQMIIVGIMIFSSTIVPLTVDTDRYSQEASDIACMTVPWLLTIGFTTTFSALFAKTWRVNKLFHNPNKYSRIKVTERDVMKPYIIMMGMNLLVLSCWTAIAPLTYKRYDAVGTDDWNRIIATYGICTSESESKTSKDFWPFLGVILAINLSILIIAIAQAYQARSIHTEYSESKYIMIIMLSMAQMFALAVPCISLLSKQPLAYFVVMLIVIFFISTSVLGFMFGPKILRTKSWMIEKAEKDKVKAAKMESRVSSTATDGDDGLKVAVMPPNFSITNMNTLEKKISPDQPEEADDGLKVEISDVSRVNFTASTNLKDSNSQLREDKIEEEKEEIAGDDVT